MLRLNQRIGANFFKETITNLSPYKFTERQLWRWLYSKDFNFSPSQRSIATFGTIMLGPIVLLGFNKQRESATSALSQLIKIRIKNSTKYRGSRYEATDMKKLEIYAKLNNKADFSNLEPIMLSDHFQIS